jgi:hypothetical protein
MDQDLLHIMGQDLRGIIHDLHIMDDMAVMDTLHMEDIRTDTDMALEVFY